MIRYNKNELAIASKSEGVMPKLFTIEKHLRVEDLEERYRNAQEVTEKIHLSYNLVIGHW